MNIQPIKCLNCGSTQLKINVIDNIGGKSSTITGVFPKSTFKGVYYDAEGKTSIEISCLNCNRIFSHEEIGRYIKPKYIGYFKIKSNESNTLYSCDCGKICNIPLGSHYCPACGRYLDERHKIKQEALKIVSFKNIIIFIIIIIISAIIFLNLYD